MSQRKILLVDGDPDIRAIFRAVLEHQGFRVLEAEQGEEGLRLARQEKPDLIILEFPVLLPEGSTLTESIRCDPSTSFIPILTITSRAFATDMERAHQAGSNACFPKPISPRRMLKEVRRLVGEAPAT